MECPTCHARMIRVGLESVQNGKIVAEWECPKCHWRFAQPLSKQ